jgi:hypothetical protein
MPNPRLRSVRPGAHPFARLACAAFALVLGASAPGCLVQRAGLADQSRRVLSERSELLASSGVEVDVAQDGTSLTVRASRLCQAQGEQRVEVTSTYGRRVSSPATVIGLGIGGVALGVVGGLYAANVPDYPPSSRAGPAEDLTQETALAAGIGMLALSAGVLTLTAGNLFAALGTDDEVTEVVESTGPVGPQRSCEPPQPLRGAVVRLGGSEDAPVLGETDATGSLAVDVARVVPPRFALEEPRASVPIQVAGQATEHVVDLRPVRSVLDERAWVNAAPTRCAAAETSSDCRGLRTYLDYFPTGAHATEGRAVLRGAQARLAERAARQEEARRAEAARRAAEEERWRAEQDRLRREDEARWAREQRERERAREAQRAEAATRAERQRQRRQCRASCRATCAGDAGCVAACIAQQCEGGGQ